MRPALAIALAYLLGSIPFGYLIVRLRAGADVRDTGSGGTGATNVTRKAGKGAGVLTLILDAAKGAAAVIFASRILETNQAFDWYVAMAAIVALLGHCFPVWLGFRGGKGVATGVGIFLILSPLAVAGAGLIFLLTVWRTRYVSLGSMMAAAALPVLIAIQDTFFRSVVEMRPLLFVGLAGGALIIFMHRANISRLLHGTESKFR
jgi:acyl phosphate:glycerol-3-phosphate acyltransferase